MALEDQLMAQDLQQPPASAAPEPSTIPVAPATSGAFDAYLKANATSAPTPEVAPQSAFDAYVAANKATPPKSTMLGTAMDVLHNLFVGGTGGLAEITGKAVQAVASRRVEAMPELANIAGTGGENAAIQQELSPIAQTGAEVAEGARNWSEANTVAADAYGRTAVGKALVRYSPMVGMSAPVIAAGLANPALVAPVGAAMAGIFGASTYQDYYDKVKASGGSDEDARSAGTQAGAIMLLGSSVTGYLNGVLGSSIRTLTGGAEKTMPSIIEAITDSSIMKPLAKAIGTRLIGDTGAMVGQNVGLHAVDTEFGQPTSSLADTAKEGAISGIVMAALTAPVAAIGATRQSSSANMVKSVLDDPDAATPQQRAGVVNFVAGTAKAAGVAPENVQAWTNDALKAVLNRQPISDGTKPTTDPSEIMGAPDLDTALETFKASLQGPGTGSGANDLLRAALKDYQTPEELQRPDVMMVASDRTVMTPEQFEAYKQFGQQPAQESADSGLALPHYAGAPLVTFPDGTTMTGAEAEQHRLSQMVQPVEAPVQEPTAPLGLPNIPGKPLVVHPDGSVSTAAEMEQRRLDAMVQPADAPGPLPPEAPHPTDLQTMEGEGGIPQATQPRTPSAEGVTPPENAAQSRLALTPDPQTQAILDHAMGRGAAQAVDPNKFPAMDGGKSMTVDAADTMRLIAQIFGKKVIFFTGATEDGIVNTAKTPNHIFINADAQVHPLDVLTHELGHHMEKAVPDDMNALKKAIYDEVGDRGLVQYFKEDYYSQDETKSNLPDEHVMSTLDTPWKLDGGTLRDHMLSELAADVLGGQVTKGNLLTRAFYRIAETEGSSKGKMIIMRLANAVKNAIQQIMQVLKGKQNFAAREMITKLGGNLDKIDAAAEKAMASYLTKTRGAKSGPDKVETKGEPQSSESVERKATDDIPSQEHWLDAHAQAEGFKNLDDMLAKAPDEFTRLATAWRAEHPADALMSPKRNPQVDTPEFRNWFGNSRIVDEKGDPLVVHHAGTFDENEDGTPVIGPEGFHFGTEHAAGARNAGKPVDDFIKEMVVEKGENGNWYWRSQGTDSYDVERDGEEGFASKELAQLAGRRYANQNLQNEDSEPMPMTSAYLSLRNPMRVKDQGENWTAAVARAKAKGYDGIVYRNEFEDKGKDSYIAFYPHQIKSAIGNNGNFDPANPDITESPARKYVQAATESIANSDFAKGTLEAYDGVKMAAMPEDRSPAAKEVARVLREGMGKTEVQGIRFRKALDDAIRASAVSTTLSAKARDLVDKGLTQAADRVFLRMSEDQRYAFMQAMDSGSEAYFKAHPDLKPMAEVINKMFADKARAVQALDIGALQNLRENYFPHIVDREINSEKSRQILGMLSKRPLEGQKGFTKHRVFDDVDALRKAGYSMVSSNPLDIVILKMGEMDKYLLAHTTLKTMATDKNGGVMLIGAGDKAPPGYSDVNGRYGFIQKSVPASKAQFVRSLVGQGMEYGDAVSYADRTHAKGEPYTMKESARYVAREDVAQIVNNYLSPSLYHNKYLGKPFTAYMGAANMLNMFQLGVGSAFHAGFTSMESVISHNAIGIKALSRGDLEGAMKYMGTAPAAWLNNPRMGNKILQELMKSGSHPELAPIIEGLQMAGFKYQMDTRFRTDSTKSALDAAGEGKYAKAAAHTIPAIVEQLARPITEYLVPRQKFGVFGEMMNKWMQDNPNASHVELRNEAQQIWNRVDSRLGQVAYDRLFINNVVKNVGQMLIRAPGWTGGTILEVGGGLKDLAGYMAKPGSWKNGITDRAAYTLSMLMVTGIANGLLTAAFTGEAPDDWKDFVAFRTGNLDEKGRPERFMLPTYMKDLYAYFQNPGTTLLHKAHPLLGLAGEIGSNKDYYGTEISPEDAGILERIGNDIGYAAKAFVPFWVRGLQKEQERGGNAFSEAAPFVGVMPAPSYMNKTEAENKMSEYAAANRAQGARTQEATDKSDIKNRIYAALRKGDNDAAKEAFQEGRDAHLVTEKDYAQEMRNARLDPVVREFQHLTYPQATRVMGLANDDEKAKLQAPYERKLMLERMKQAQLGVQPEVVE